MKKLILALLIIVSPARTMENLAIKRRTQADLIQQFEHAVMNNLPETVQGLLATHKDIDVNAPVALNTTALWQAAYWGYEPLCRILIDHGATIDTKDRGGVSAFHIARSKNHESICRLLIDKQREINSSLMTGLMCLQRLNNDANPAIKLLYTHRKQLLLPYIEHAKYVSLKKLQALPDPENKLYLH